MLRFIRPTDYISCIYKLKKKIAHKFFTLLSPLDIGTIIYILFSGIFISIASSSIDDIWTHFSLRIEIIFLIIILSIFSRKFPHKALLLLKNIYPLFFLNYFYAETALIKNVIFKTDLDIYFLQIDEWLFGCQPGLEFSKFMTQSWFNESMFMCYFSYYILTALVCISIFFEKTEEAHKTIFMIITSFYLYYILYIIIPVVGPQYHFKVTAYLPNQPYLFGKIMCFLHTMERATGAFPSSHTGMAVIFSYIFFRHIKKLFFLTLPFVVGICFATVYLKEHYVIDVLAGMISAPLFILFSSSIYNKFLSSLPHKDTSTSSF